MKNLLLLLTFLTFSISILAQDIPTASEWQSDLRFLQHTVHKDYPFLFKKISTEDFDKNVEEFHKAIPTMQPHEVVAGFARMVSLFGYGHTDIGLHRSPVKNHIVPLNLYWFNDGIFVEGAQKEYREALGAKIVKVEGKAVKEVLEAVRPLLPVENEQYFKAYALDFLLVPEALHAQKVTKTLKKTVTLTLEKDGKTTEKAFEAVPSFRFPRRYSLTTPGEEWLSVRDQSTTPLYLKNLDKIYFFEYLPEEKTVYVRQSQVQDETDDPIPAFYARVFDFIENNKVERLVIDVRLNGGGNNYKNKPVVTGIIECKKINQPGKLFVILGRRTFSACQNLVNELDNYTNALFVGEPTSENINFYGDNRTVELPNSKIPVYLSFAWWQDKPQWENADWLAPDIAVDMSFDEYRTNQDPVLAAALNISADGLILDPMGHLRELFMARRLEEVKTTAKEMVADPRYRFIDFEDQLNGTGYNLLGGGLMEAALFVFQLNTELFPESANVWDSLGEANWKAGNKEKAIEFYNKAISIDPEGPIGANARAMLKEIKD